ncbi:hypothetical protein QBC43DRAFT_288571 [Cladorrhinum sp. PSN259]|nr:hypothetical protein QBC43DRAFT_288571 [Cladorrhinum sp. PSN259]
MKPTALLALTAPVITWAAATPNPSVNALDALSKRADKWCRLHDSVDPPGHCRTCASTNCRSIKDIKKSDRFGVRCYMMGDRANNNARWDWVPGWGCYVSASITDPNCEDGLSCCVTHCNGLGGPP